MCRETGNKQEVFTVDTKMQAWSAPEKTWYKKIPIIPAIILALLVGACVFRWDHGITQTVNNSSVHYKITHKIDRWTGNRWYVL